MLGGIVMGVWSALLLTSTVPVESTTEVLRFNVQDNYAKYKGIAWNSVDLVFRLEQAKEQAKELLLYTEGAGQTYLCILVKNKLLEVIVPHDRSKYKKDSFSIERPFHDKKWHTLHLYWSATHLNLTVDDQSLIQNNIKIREGSTGGNIFIGGFTSRRPDIKYRLLIQALSDCPNSECIRYFKGCIANVEFKNEGTVQKPILLSAKIGDSAECKGACAESTPCDNGGRCVEQFVKKACDCSGTGYEGEKCKREVSSAFRHRKDFGGFRYNIPNKTARSASHTKVAFRFLSENENGVLFSMCGKSDYLLLELLNGNFVITFDLGGGSQTFTLGDNTLGTCWHWVKLEHKNNNVSVSIDRGKYEGHKSSPGSSHALNLDDNKFVIFGGLGSAVCSNVLKANDSFEGLTQDLHFNGFKITEDYIHKNYGNSFTIKTQASGPQKLLDKCCLVRNCYLQTKTARSSTSISTTTKASTSPTSESKDNGTKKAIVAPSPLIKDPQSASVWTIILVVLAAVLAVFITVYIIYRWNNRYSGSFNPSKNNPDDEGAQSEKYGYNFFFPKTPKKEQETTAL